MLQGHGDDSYRFQKEIIADFSTNVYHDGEPDGLKEYLFEHWQDVNKYPEVVAESLREKVASYWNLHSSEILITNGSAESIYLIAQSFRAHSSTIVFPTFSEYEDACKLNDHELTFLPWNDLEEETVINTKLLFICNPNNPTGATFRQLEKLIHNNPATIFVVDEAFIEFTNSIKTTIPIIKRYRNLIVLRSMTKAFAIPGLRLGYILGDSEVIKRIIQYKLPWSVNALALKAGHFIFDHYENFQLPIERLLDSKEVFIKSLSRLPFLKIHNSDTHFFLAKTMVGTSKELKQFLVNEYGILIRDASNFRGLSAYDFRLATLSDEKNNLLLEALWEWKK